MKLDGEAKKHGVIPVTVIIPVHGRQDLLDRALASIRRQDATPAEVIIVDDASDPPIEIRPDILQTLNIRLLRHKTNRGAAAARNTGMGAAGTDWISFLDSDDFLLEGSLSLRWRLMNDIGKPLPDSSVIYGCGWIDVDESQKPLALRWPKASSNPHDFASGCWFSPGSCIILNARAAQAVGLQDEQLSRFEDLDWFLALSRAGFSLQILPAACVAIERRRSQQPARIQNTARVLRLKWRRLCDDRELLRRLDAYLDLEIASAHYYAGSLLEFASALVRSYARKPRLSLQFSPGWTMERISKLPEKSFSRQSHAAPRAQPEMGRPAIIVVCNDADYFLRHRLAVVERLAKLQFRVHVITGGRNVDPDQQKGWRQVFVPIERFSFRPLRDLALAFRTFQHFRTERPYSVHLVTLKPAVFSGIAAVFSRWLCGSPRRILITIPGLGRLMSPSAAGNLRSALARRIVEGVIAFLSWCPDLRFTFETDEDRNRWLKQGLVREGNSIVIRGAGVDPRLYHPAERRKRSVRPIRILFASRLLKSKGLDAFIELARQLSDRTDCEFVVAGMVEPYDPDGFSMEQLAREKSITFLGEVRNMPELLRDVDLVCLPTRYGEGIPRILIEAAATGLSCLATDLAGCREIVRDGVNGVLFPATDAAAMAAAMRKAIETYLGNPTLLTEHGRAALEIFRSGNFDQGDVVDRFVALLADGETNNQPAGPTVHAAGNS